MDGQRHGRRYHRVLAAGAAPMSSLDFVKRSSQHEIYKLNGIGLGHLFAQHFDSEENH